MIKGKRESEEEKTWQKDSGEKCFWVDGGGKMAGSGRREGFAERLWVKSLWVDGRGKRDGDGWKTGASSSERRF